MNKTLIGVIIGIVWTLFSMIIGISLMIMVTYRLQPETICELCQCDCSNFSITYTPSRVNTEYNLKELLPVVENLTLNKVLILK